MKEKDKSAERTNVMRLLDQAGISYTSHCYADTDAISAEDVARVLGQEPERVFKTLVTVGHSGQNYVFVVPGPLELNLKKAATAVGEKSIVMIKQKELLPLTGYIHGGCSPVGMKKLFRTVIDETAGLYDTICVSAGRIGYQVELAPDDLARAIPLEFTDIT